MKIEESVQLNWSKKIPSNSMVRDPLGIWNHLDIQADFVPGITSVTRRIRYYTLLAWYWQNLYREKIINQTDFEKYFILVCLAHHNGDYQHPSLRGVFNKTALKSEWEKRTKFNLNFRINGFGRIYYTKQLEILRCAWTDIYGTHISRINTKLAGVLKNLTKEPFKERNPTKSFLKTKFKGFCICDSERNQEEIDIMSKLLFGFISNKNGEWDIDDDEYKSFMEGKVDLSFKGNELNLEYVNNIKELTQRRRNTLFMFLKIISETQPRYDELRRYMWDATYFKADRRTKKIINFGRLEKIREYWEYLQLNVYYVFALETILDIIQKIVRKNPNIKKTELLKVLKESEVYSTLSQLLKEDFSKHSEISDVIQSMRKINRGTLTSLNSPINESKIYDRMEETESLEKKLAYVLIMLLLLANRYQATPHNIKNYKLSSRRSTLIESKLDIDRVLPKLISEYRRLKIWEYLYQLIIDVIDMHLAESAQRCIRGTRNWIFTEEEGLLQPARANLVKFDARDNRWYSITSLLSDLKFIQISEKVTLTEKGKLWLKKIE